MMGSRGCFLLGARSPVQAVLLLRVTPIPVSPEYPNLQLGQEGSVRIWGSCLGMARAFLGAGGKTWMLPRPSPQVSGLYS